jgi:hypothetical protein
MRPSHSCRTLRCPRTFPLVVGAYARRPARAPTCPSRACSLTGVCRTAPRRPAAAARSRHQMALRRCGCAAAVAAQCPPPQRPPPFPFPSSALFSLPVPTCIPLAAHQRTKMAVSKLIFALAVAALAAMARADYITINYFSDAACATSQGVTVMGGACAPDGSNKWQTGTCAASSLSTYAAAGCSGACAHGNSAVCDLL